MGRYGDGKRPPAATNAPRVTHQMRGRAGDAATKIASVDTVIIRNDVWTTITKLTTETIQSDVILSDDAVLLFHMKALATYRIYVMVIYETGTDANFNYDVSGPSSPTKVGVRRVDVYDTTTTHRGMSTSYPAAVTVGAGPPHTGSVIVDAIIQNGAISGNFVFRWRQAASFAVNTSVLKGSYLQYALVA